ncbi:hypothetical protein J1N35_014967 [Gossypium stocksii]|uniref:Uncharacterized protein n=1 Tax=Gossypium stocksii TaxID=47602 RepID=A0A9D4AA94_9ROSI|nr:hypothetical protein J1N35_014967 [Gossypium stocksii]
MKKILFRYFVFLLLLGFGCLFSVPVSAQNGPITDHVKFVFGGVNLGPWKNEISELGEAPAPTNDEPPSTLVLAAKRTNRPDILRHFKHYLGGWDITNRHYWASVGFTGAAGFIFAALWFVSFGLVLAVYHCCGWRINIEGKKSDHSQTICLVMLILFTSVAATGCILLSIGQDEFHDEALHTLNYVVNQSDYTVQILKNVTQYLSLAKTISVAQLFLPSDVMTDIDKLNIDLNTAADTLTEKTEENAVKIKRVFNAVRLALITVAAVMLILALLGLLMSILGHQHAIHIFIVSGWLLVAVTFILYGVFVIMNNAISDTCLAMEEWVENPHAETALSNILPCVDPRTTNHTLTQSKQVITSIVDVVNTYIYSIANIDLSPDDNRYYNQSGPTMPPLCYPFDSQLQDRQCGSYEVSMANASLVWQNYMCMVSESGLCNTTGRITPDRFTQLVAAINESYALEHYTPPLLCLQNCDFVRDTFQNIISNYCHPLERYLKMVNAGLGLISVGVLLCLVLWIFYANRPRREEVFVKILLPMKLMSCKNIFNTNKKTTLSSPNSV